MTEAPKTGVVGGRAGSDAGDPLETTVGPDPPPAKPPLTSPIETVPDVEALESPQFEKSAFGCGPTKAPATVPETAPEAPPEEISDVRPFGEPDEHAARAPEPAMASAARVRKDQARKEGKARNAGDAMVVLKSNAHAEREVLANEPLSGVKALK